MEAERLALEVRLVYTIIDACGDLETENQGWEVGQALRLILLLSVSVTAEKFVSFYVSQCLAM